MKLEEIKRRVDELCSMVDKLIVTKKQNQYSSDSVDSALFMELRATTLSFLVNVFGEAHPYYDEFNSKVDDNHYYKAIYAKGILAAVRNDINGGWLFTVKGLLSAEIFTDFLEMAEHLLKEGYKDPAAVMTGSVLEEHLRQLCQKNNVDTHIIKGADTVPKKAEAMNVDLCKATVYNMLDQKQITSWLDLRNKAAHGKYSEYTNEQVDLMYQGVLNFISRVN